MSHAADPAEREADRAADIVARGGSVAGWSFSSVPLSASSPAQREEKKDAPNPDDEKKKEALKKTGEALAETAPVKKLKEKILEDPVVKKVKDAATSPAGLAVGGAAIAGGLVGLGVAGKELPFAPPTIPLDVLKEGLSAKVPLTGPVNKPIEVGLTITYSPPGPKKAADRDAYRAETARLRAEQEKLRPKTPEDDRLSEEAIKYVVAKQSLYLPLTPKEPAKKDEGAPAQRKATRDASAASSVSAEVPSGGRTLDPATRRSMEARFGYDFSSVRIHDDASAASAAASADASAFTVGTDVVFGASRFDPASPSGRHLLAHELAHVVQQNRAPGGGEPKLQRRSADEWLGIFFGATEGTWDDAELTAYLAKITADGKKEGAFDSDNKARAIVARSAAGAQGFALTAAQKVLLIEEMLDGPTLGEDEVAILDLLERADATELPVILGPRGVSLDDLESDIDDDNRTRLDRFVAGRFEGGADAVRGGRGVVKAKAAAVADTEEVADAGSAGPTQLDELSPAERAQIQAVTTTRVEIPDLDERFSTTGGRMVPRLPADTTVVLGGDLAGSPLEHGLRNVASALTTKDLFDAPPLRPNSTVTLELDLSKHGGKRGLYQFSFVAPSKATKKGATSRRILVDSLGRARAPRGSKAPEANDGRTAADPIAEKMTRHDLRHNWSGKALEALRAAIAQLPDEHLARVKGLRFRRETAHPEKSDVGGDYDQKAHVVTMYDRAFEGSDVRFAAAGGVASSPATRAIVHEIGHAIDLQPLRAAWLAKAEADKGVEALTRDFPHPTDSGSYAWNTPAQRQEIDRRLKAQKSAEAALLKVRSRSGTKTVKTKSGDFVDVTDKQVTTAFRTAAKKDSPKAVSAYGDEDWQEHYAEAYSLYITAPSTLQALRPTVFAHFEKELAK